MVPPTNPSSDGDPWVRPRFKTKTSSLLIQSVSAISHKSLLLLHYSQKVSRLKF